MKRVTGGFNQFGGDSGFGIFGANGGFSSNSGTVFSFDPDAEAFMIATEIPNNSTVYYEGTIYETTGALLWTYINTYVIALKDAGVWTKYKAIYPFIGGTATTHKWNLKDPRDLDVAYRIIWFGGWTHSATGAKPNGVNGYGQTFLNPSVAFSDLNSNHLSLYLRDQSVPFTFSADIAVVESSRTMVMWCYNNDGNAYFDNPDASKRLAISNAVYGGAIGLNLLNRSSATSLKAYKNAVEKGENTQNRTLSYPNATITLATYDGGFFSSKENAGTSIGDSLSQVEINSYYSAVQSLQTSLNRQV